MKRFMTSEEYLQTLNKNLVNPEAYDVKGFYYYHGEKNNFSGRFDIDAKGMIVGEILDPNSVCPKHVVEGEIFYANNAVLMEIIKACGILMKQF